MLRELGGRVAFAGRRQLFLHCLITPKDVPRRREKLRAKCTRARAKVAKGLRAAGPSCFEPVGLRFDERLDTLLESGKTEVARILLEERLQEPIVGGNASLIVGEKVCSWVFPAASSAAIVRSYNCAERPVTSMLASKISPVVFVRKAEPREELE